VLLVNSNSVCIISFKSLFILAVAGLGPATQNKGLMNRIYLICFSLLFSVWACNEPAPEANAGKPEKRIRESYDPSKKKDWDRMEEQAKGTTVNLMMWQGDPLINAYMQNYVVPQVKERYDIDLQIANGQGNTIVQILLAELEAGKPKSELDLMWINGETFYQLRQINALFGPWTTALPNTQFINFENPFIGIDFQQEVDGYECPWGNVQLALIYNEAEVPEPPRTLEALLEFAKQHPGKFTFDVGFTGLTLLKSWMISFAENPEELSGAFNEEKYQKYSQQLWDYIGELRPYLWKEGATFPESVAPMHQMFANGELWFTMSNNDAEVDNKITQGLFPESARAFVFESGTIQNSHYMGIPRFSANKNGAMAVVNFLISPEAQLKKADPTVWGDGTILAMDKLPKDVRMQFDSIPNRVYAPKRSDIQKNALMELAPEYMIRLAEDFRTKIIEQ